MIARRNIHVHNGIVFPTLFYSQHLLLQSKFDVNKFGNTRSIFFFYVIFKLYIKLISYNCELKKSSEKILY